MGMLNDINAAIQMLNNAYSRRFGENPVSSPSEGSPMLAEWYNSNNGMNISSKTNYKTVPWTTVAKGELVLQEHLSRIQQVAQDFNDNIKCAACANVCYGSCSGTCSGCRGTCQGGCSSDSCARSCTGCSGCSGSLDWSCDVCSGNCKGDCFSLCSKCSSCSGGCSGCTGCATGCGVTCQDSCSASCSQGCSNSARIGEIE